MAKYEVIRPWVGVVKGQVIEAEKINPNFLPNVREVGAHLVASVGNSGDVKKLNAALKKSDAALVEKDKLIADLEAKLAETAKPQEPQK